jgi:hypothetical protein
MDTYKSFLRVWINPMSRRIGRPIEPARPGERATLTLRVTADIKSRLEAEAVKTGRSLSQEAETRLEKTFDAEAMKALGSEQIEKANARIEEATAYLEGAIARMAEVDSWRLDLERREADLRKREAEIKK